ncbi:hypothetical protein N9U60_00625 [Betaproteobacteria bacterium]|nr:hypothetical protein [Betaproteobacteria bacterium]
MRLSSDKFKRFGNEQEAICGQSEWLVRYSDFTLSVTGSGKIKIQCPQCSEEFVKEFSLNSRFKILRSEKEVKKHYDFFNANIEIISAERDSSFLELCEDELILGNYSLASKHVCGFLEQKRQQLFYKKNKVKAGVYRPFEVLRELMNK